MNEEIIIDVDRQGNVRTEGVNFSGSDCKAVTRVIEEALGTVTNVQLKPEFHRTTAAVKSRIG